MGNSLLISFNEDEDSPSDPGKKSCVSEPYPENLTIEAVWEGVLDYVKHPVSPLHEGVVKEVKLEEISDKEVYVKVTLDGKKLDAIGYGKGDGTDRIVHNSKSIIDWEKKSISTYSYNMECWAGEEGDGVVRSIFTTTFFKTDSPLQSESYLEVVDGDTKTRLANGVVSGIISAVVNPIAQRLASTKVVIQPDQPSPSGTAKSVISGSMAEHTTYDDFFPALIECLKTPLFPGEEVHDVSDTQFRKEFKDQTTGNAVVTATDYNQEAGEVTTIVTTGGKTMKRICRQIHKEPLLYEAWIFNEDGERLHGKRVAATCQSEFNAALEKATNSGGGWFW